MSNDKTPPLLSKATLYTDWKKKVRIWSSFTKLEKEKHGAAILMTLEGAPEETVLELPEEVINSEKGLSAVLEKLDALYLKDSTLEKFQTLELFDSYRRKPGMSIQAHIHEFEKIYHKLTSHGTTISEDVLAFKLLKSANLSSQDEKLAKGTTTELNLSVMKAQLKKIFNDSSSLSSSIEATPSDSLTVHDINHAEIDDQWHQEDEVLDTLYTGQQHNQRSSGNRSNYNFQAGNGGYQPRGFQRQQAAWRPNQPARSVNPVDRGTGGISRAICNSTSHWASSCPRNRQRPIRSQTPRGTFFTESQPDPMFFDSGLDTPEYNIVLFQRDFDH